MTKEEIADIIEFAESGEDCAVKIIRLHEKEFRDFANDVRLHTRAVGLEQENVVVELAKKYNCII